ncbi:hypothetical protein AVEN_146038-1 [Araneus ventricosus]|uniref:Uncharacterized protein n=1 Tax=Araneus ventricosus TaxID=182803 RepID=A0A4Y2GTC2_ARAVE|nr:hypothetical protein AVEN_146038-1 [Araneus ventricosus]
MNTDENHIAKRWRMTKKRKARWLARQSQEFLYRIRAVHSAAYTRRNEAETPSQAQNCRKIHAEKQRLHIERKTPPQSRTRREVNVS